MELRQLEHFVAVAEERHFSRAARRVHIVQSGLSASIRALERDLGAALFVRSTRSVALTEAGRAFLPEARSALAAGARAREAVAAVQGLLRGTLSVGVMQVPDPIDVPALLGRFHREHPAVEIRLRQGPAAVVVDEVGAGELDLAFATLPTPVHRGVEAMTITDEEMVVACGRGHPLAARPALRLRDLGAEPFVEFPPDWGVRMAVDRAFAAAGIARKTAFEVNDVRTLLELVAHGLGVSIVPAAACAFGVPIALVPLRRAPHWQVGLVTRAGGSPSAAAAAFVRMSAAAHDAGA